MQSCGPLVRTPSDGVADANAGARASAATQANVETFIAFLPPNTLRGTRRPVVHGRRITQAHTALSVQQC
jgi:hypothetical protein